MTTSSCPSPLKSPAPTWLGRDAVVMPGSGGATSSKPSQRAAASWGDMVDGQNVGLPGYSSTRPNSPAEGSGTSRSRTPSPVRSPTTANSETESPSSFGSAISTPDQSASPDGGGV